MSVPLLKRVSGRAHTADLVSGDTAQVPGTLVIAGSSLAGTEVLRVQGETQIEGTLHGTLNGTGLVIGIAGASSNTGSTIQIGSFTTTQRGNLVPAAGMEIYNTTLGWFQSYNGTRWGDDARDNNFQATTNPSPTNDIGAGYQPGSTWVNIASGNQQSYICLSNASGNAIWALDSLVSGSVTSGIVASGAIQGYISSGRNIASGTVGGFDFGSGAVMAGAIGSGAVASGNIASGSIGQFHLASGAVNSGAIGNNAVTSGSIASGSISQFAIASGAINSGQISSGSIIGAAGGGARNIASGTISTFDIASGAIRSGQIGDGAVVSGSIASGVITSIALASGDIISMARAVIDDFSAAGAPLTTQEVISGFVAVAISQSGTLQVAMPGVSGRMPAVGISVSGALSGQPASFWTEGFFQATSGLLNFSGSLGAPVFIARSGQLGVASGGYLSGGFTSGDIQQFAGSVINSGAFRISIGRPSEKTSPWNLPATFWISSGDISSGQISQFHLASGAVNSGQINNAAVVSGSLASGSISQFALASGAVNSGQVASGSIVGAIGAGRSIASGTIAHNDFGSGAILSGDIASGQIGFNHLSSGSVGSGSLASGQVTANKLGSGAVGSGIIASGSIGRNHLASGAVGSGDIASGQVSQFALASGAVNSGQIASGAVVGSVGGGAFTIASGSIGPNDLGSGSIRSGAIASGQIGQFHLASGSVTSGAISSGQVSQFALASGAVNSGQVASGSIVGAVGAGRSIASGTVAHPDFGSGAVLSGDIASGQIGAFHLASGVLQSISGTIETAARQIIDDFSAGGTPLLSEENISGFVAVAISQSGNLRVAMPSISGRAPAVGIAISGALSGQATSFWTDGFFQIPLNSGSYNFSGAIGQPVYISRSGQIGVWSGGFLSGGLLSGDIPQRVGIVVNSGGIRLSVDPFTKDSVQSPPGPMWLQSGDIASGQVGFGHLANASVQSGTIASGSIGRFALSSGAVNSGDVSSGSILGSLGGGALTIASGTIGPNDFGSGSVQSGAIASGQITNFKLGSGAINSGHIGSGAVLGAAGGGARTIASGTIGPNDLGSGSILSGAIGSGQVGQFHISSGAITSGRLGVAGTPNGTQFLRDDFTWGSTGAASITSGSVGSGAIASGAVQGFFGPTRDIASGTIGVFDFGSGAVTAGAMGSGAVTSGNVASGIIIDYSRITQEDRLTTAEAISGTRAVAISTSGNLIIAMANFSGRMPAIGVVVDNVTSGQAAKVYRQGLILANSNASGAGFNFSGHVGGQIYVDISGTVISSPPASGQVQVLGTANSVSGAVLGTPPNDYTELQTFFTLFANPDDPYVRTLGNNAIYGGTQGSPQNTNEVQYTRVYLTRGRVYTKMRVFFVSGANGTRQIQFGIYDQATAASPTGTPNNKVANTAANTPANATTGYYDVSLSSSYTVPISGFYWFAFQCDNGTMSFALSDVKRAGFSNRREETPGGFTLPSTAGATTQPQSAIIYISAVE